MEIISAVCKQRFFPPQLPSCADVLIRYCLYLKVSSSPLTEGRAQVAATNHLFSVQQVETFVRTWLWRMPLPPVKTKPVIPKLEEHRVRNQCCTWFEFLLGRRATRSSSLLAPSRRTNVLFMERGRSRSLTSCSLCAPCLSQVVFLTGWRLENTVSPKGCCVWEPLWTF